MIQFSNVTFEASMSTLPLIFSPLTTCPGVERVRPADDLRVVPAGTPVFVESGKEVKLVLLYQFHINWQFPAQTAVRFPPKLG
jgi:hypothetical protein